MPAATPARAEAGRVARRAAVAGIGTLVGAALVMVSPGRQNDRPARAACKAARVRPGSNMTAEYNPTGIVRAIFIAPAAAAPPVAVGSAAIAPGRGLEGDRYFFGAGSFSRWPGEGRAVTLIEEEVIDAVRREHGIDLSDGRSRRNVVTGGIVLSELMGRKFRVGTALLRGARIAAPCRHLERLTAPGVYEALRARGGLRADVVEGGMVRVGDAVVPIPVGQPGRTES
jgi:MOSC domain-containing protein YiiM